jgi:hypothetical protein
MRATVLLFASLMMVPTLAKAQSNPYQPSASALATLRPVSMSGPLWNLGNDINPLAAQRFTSRAPGATLMIIGGAAIVAGLLMDGSGSAILILGGVGLGAYGAYLYTR